MPTSPLNVVIQHLLADLRPDGDGMTDGELLARFLRSRDEDALATLVRRHASMVWGVSRRLLHHHDAEDAFQATFLVLVRKASDVPRQAVANWLYGVARQTAVRLRATAAKRGRRETQVVNMPEPDSRIQESGFGIQESLDLQRVVDEELSRLPDHYRGVIVLCDLEGMTRKEAAQQLGIPEGSVASRLARARALLTKRLTQRGIVFSGGSVAAVLAADSASASAPPELVASTIRAASLLAAGQAAGGVSANVAALAEGTVKAMSVTRIKSVLTVMLLLAALTGGARLFDQTRAADQPMAKGGPTVTKKDEKPGEEKPAQPVPPPAKSDRERMVGNWFIMNEDSRRQGEMWVITQDSILMYAKQSGPITQRYAHRLDADKDPKQIDITVTRVNGPIIGVIKGIYKFDGDELQLCLGDLDKVRPTAFPKKPAPGEVLILQRQAPDGGRPKAKEPPAKSDEERIVGGWWIVNADSKRKGEPWSINKDKLYMHANIAGFYPGHLYRLDAGKTPKQIDIGFTKEFNAADTIKGIYLLDGDELRLCLGEPGKDRPTAFPEKPKPGEVLILQRTPPSAEPPKAKEEQPVQSDQERMVGDWVFSNADGLRRGESSWSITKDRIDRHSVGSAWQMQWYHRLDASKEPKEIDIAGQLNGAPTIKGIYALDGDELWLYLGEPGKDRPTAFPKKPKPGEVLILHRVKVAEPPKAKEPPAKTDRESMVGNWVIVNEDSQRRGEAWVITEDSILMYAMHGGINAQLFSHRLDATRDPKQIDITVTRVGGQVLGVNKGLYALNGDELRLCVAGIGKDRPTAFPEKPAPGEVLILKRAIPGATPPTARAEQPAKTDQERMVGRWIIVNEDSKAKGQLWVINKDHILMNYYGPGAIPLQYHFLDASNDPKQIDISLMKENGPHAMKGLYVLEGDELRLCLGERGKDRPTAFPKEPKPGEILILQRAKDGAESPKAKEPKVLTVEEVFRDKIEGPVRIKFRVTAVSIPLPTVMESKAGTDRLHITVSEKVEKRLNQLGVEDVRVHLYGKEVLVSGVLKRVVHEGGVDYRLTLDDLAQLESVGKK